MPKSNSKPRRRSLEEIATLIARLENSNCTVAEFAAEIGVAVPTIYNWKRRLHSESGERTGQSGPSMVRVIAQPEFSSPSATPSSKIDIHLPNGVTCSVCPGFDEQTLLRLIDIL